MPITKGTRQVAENRRARHDYFIEDTYECGIALVGMHISPYDQGNIFNKDPFRTRKLLLHKREIRKLNSLSQTDGYSLIPTRLYIRDGLVKVELAVAKGKKLYDKRHTMAERDAKRDMDRRMKSVD